jgi:hypothetical protein
MRLVSKLITILLITFLSQAKVATVSGIAVNGHWVVEDTIHGTGFIASKTGIMRYDITNGVVTKSTKLDSGIVGYPVLKPDGTKVAYFKANTFWSPNTVSLMTIDIGGGTPVNLNANLCSQHFQSVGAMDWPTGDWIYYFNCFKQLWKINATSKQMVMVYALNKVNLNWSGDRNDTPTVWLNSVSNDATKDMIRPNEWIYPRGATSGYINIFWFTLPPAGYGLSLDTLTARGMGCGAAVSPTGSYVMTMGTLNHNILSFSTWSKSSLGDITLATMSNWGGGFFGLGTGGGNRWSCNSDKWICIAAGWKGRDGANNQVLVNWQDSMILNTTNVPDTGGWDRNSEGDFWVSGNTEVNLPAQNSAAIVSGPAITAGNGTMVFTWSNKTRYRVQVFSAQGRLLLDTRINQGRAYAWQNRAASQVYFVRMTAGSDVYCRKICFNF